MTRLVEALRALGLDGEVTRSGRWVTLQGGCSPVYVVEAAWAVGYCTWCGGPAKRGAGYYPDATEAIRVGLRRAV